MATSPGFKYLLQNTSNTAWADAQRGYAWGLGDNQNGGVGINSSASVVYSSPVQIGALSTWKIISGGGSKLGLKTDGTLWAWGFNGGRLGNSTTINYSSPVQVGALTTWSILGTGSAPAAINTGGMLYMWGVNPYGQLGNGTTINYSSPIQVGAETNWASVHCGQYMVAAVKTDGTLWVWGYNTLGGLGIGNTISYSSPVQLGTGTDWLMVKSESTSTYGVKTNGTLWAWGSNTYGDLGNGTTIHYSSPVQVGSLTSWAAVSGGGHAIKYNGTLWGWGYNYWGNIGNITDSGALGGTAKYSSPVQVGALTTWKQVFESSTTIAGVTTNGDLYIWGNFNNTARTSPTLSDNNSDWINVSTGSALNVVAGVRKFQKETYIDLDNIFVRKTQFARTGLFTWGDNYYNALGLDVPSTAKYSSPVQVGALTNWKNVASNQVNLLATKTDGTLWYSGNGSVGPSPLNNNASYSSPVQVGSLNNWLNVCSSQYAAHALALKTDGTIWSWGDGSYGRLGNGDTISYSSPIQIGTLTTWKSIYNSSVTSFALRNDGSVWGWGSTGSAGKLANSPLTNQSSPIQVGSKYSWRSLPNRSSSSPDYMALISNDNSLWIWGSNNWGQVGNGNTTTYTSPVQVGTLTDWDNVSIGSGHTLAVKTDGTLWSWGYNQFGQMGNGNTIDYSSPVQIGSMNNWKKVYAAAYTTLAIKRDGTLWGWGLNTNSILGQVTAAVPYSSPIQIGSLASWRDIHTDGYAIAGILLR